MKQIVHVLLLLLSVWVSRPVVGDVRQVTIAVHVKASSGQLPAGLIAAANVAGKEFAALIDSKSTASIVVNVPDGVQEAFVCIPVSVGAQTPIAGTNDRDQYYRAIREADARFSLPRPLRVNLAAGQASLSVELTLPLAIRVTGRCVDAAGVEKKRFNVYRMGHEMLPRQYTSGRFELHGVQRGAATWIGFSAFNGVGNEIAIKKIPASHTAKDLDLGDVTLNPGTPDAQVVVTIQARASHRDDGEFHDTTVTLVSDDGKRAYGFGIAENGHLVTVPTEPLIKVVAGSYFVVPGVFTGTLTATVLNLIDAGRGAELDAHGRKLSIAPGQNAAVAVNVSELIERLTQLHE